jgi:hypothetical protein
MRIEASFCGLTGAAGNFMLAAVLDNDQQQQ